ncbi:MAG: endonuclease/exonuclease/phosphatase family protein [Methanosarcinales archaeon]|nr:endonuclease/exonuclease/phosphatase family protein [Methanosarcinales archaeon]
MSSTTLVIIAIAIMMLFSFGCISSNEDIVLPVQIPIDSQTSTPTPTPAPTPTPTSTQTTIPTHTPTEAITSDLNNDIKLANFNIQVFGKSKAGKPEVMEIVSKIIRNYDIVAIQEIRDASQTTMPKLKEKVNHKQEHLYDFIISERLGRTTSKEQYAYLFNTSEIELIGLPCTYLEPLDNDIFHREPYIANFKVKNGNFDFVLITIHTDPDEATQEINNLPEVVEYAKNAFQNEGDFIILGDLNADCNYFDEEGQSPLKSSDYFWVINNSIDTTTKSTVCTYDRIIITIQSIDDYTGESGVFRYDTAYNLTYEDTIAVSDHYPVYAIFWSNRDVD